MFNQSTSCDLLCDTEKELVFEEVWQCKIIVEKSINIYTECLHGCDAVVGMRLQAECCSSTAN